MLAATSLLAADVGLHGRASCWLGASQDTTFAGLAGLRYLPEACMSVSTGSQAELDAEVSVNNSLAANVRNRACSLDGRLKPYRALVRLSTPRFAARAGLQKINFGSATLLRPLMWFDRVDPRDPLELTDGVYGLLGRYYFQNNTNLWAWGLLGNSSPKGWEVYGSRRWVPEFGGRAQLPIPRGEVAATYHHRLVDLSQIDTDAELLDEQVEDRLGMDAKMDVGVGFWLEGALWRMSHRMTGGDGQPIWTRTAVVGTDYTFGIGAGLLVTAEHMLAGSADAPFGSGTDAQLSALMLSFPLGLLDNLRGMVYYDWKNGDPYGYLGWQRTLDSWVFSVGAFWSPDSAPGPVTGSATGVAGKGLRVDAVFNH